MKWKFESNYTMKKHFLKDQIIFKNNLKLFPRQDKKFNALKL